MAALELLKPIAATITSPATVPVGVAIERLVLTGRSARMCALPASAFPAAVAVLAPLAPATARSTRLPSTERPVALFAPLGLSNDSVMPLGGVQLLEEAKACEVTSMAFATAVVMLGVACVVAEGVIWPFSRWIGFAVSTPVKPWTPPTPKL